MTDNWINDIRDDMLIENQLKHEINEISCYFFHVNRDKSIDSQTKITHIFNKSNILTKDELLLLIKNNKLPNFYLGDILKYNAGLGEHEISHFIDHSDEYNFFENIPNISDIAFKTTIKMISKSNALYFLFFRDKDFNKTRKKSSRTGKTRKEHLSVQFDKNV
jgi:hypothetical protein